MDQPGLADARGGSHEDRAALPREAFRERGFEQGEFLVAADQGAAHQVAALLVEVLAADAQAGEIRQVRDHLGGLLIAQGLVLR
ncbi:hypothetical protein D3C72_1752460 [compost metagenome]